MKPAFFRLATVLLSLTAAFLLLEGGLRLFYTFNGRFAERKEARANGPYVASDDPVLVYEYRPDHYRDGVRITEANGLIRPDDLPVEKPHGEIRIAVLGDSISAWPGGYAAMLEKAVAKRGVFGDRPVKVLNFGHDGYRTTQEARTLRTKAARYKPDIIILQYCMNDVGNNVTPTRWFLPPPRSYLIDLIGRRTGWAHDPRLSGTVPVFGPGYNTREYWIRMYEPDTESWKSVERGFGDIAEVAADLTAPVLLVLSPFLLDEGWENGTANLLYGQVLEAARKQDFSLLELKNVFSDYSVQELKANPNDIYHPNLKGHALAVERIVTTLAGMEADRHRGM